MYRNNTTGLLTTHNGMNLSKSRSNPNSRYNRIVEYIRKNGPSTKVDILRDVFGKVVVPNTTKVHSYTRAGNWYRIPGTENWVTRGWGTYVWGLMVANGDLIMTRKGNKVHYSLPIGK
jgi:hypothetical protein